jgi:two-component system, NarL family, nitrate/nitrite response regulator NarL
MTSSRTILIERNRLLRQGLKHLLAHTRLAVKVEFGTMEQAVDGAVTSALVIIGDVRNCMQIKPYSYQWLGSEWADGPRPGCCN